jgi:hypothetical protein
MRRRAMARMGLLMLAKGIPFMIAMGEVVDVAGSS